MKSDGFACRVILLTESCMEHRLMGKVAADSSHKWVYREPVEHEISFLSPWQGSLDPVSHPLAHNNTMAMALSLGLLDLVKLCIRV